MRITKKRKRDAKKDKTDNSEGSYSHNPAVYSGGHRSRLIFIYVLGGTDDRFPDILHSDNMDNYCRKA